MKPFRTLPIILTLASVLVAGAGCGKQAPPVTPTGTTPTYPGTTPYRPPTSPPPSSDSPDGPR